MSIIKHIKNKRKYKKRPDLLRKDLFDALEIKDNKTFAYLCRKHEKQIIQNFKMWLTIPEPITNDTDAVKRYGMKLLHIAKHFENKGNKTLVELLMKKDNRNPFIRWNEAHSKVDKLIDNQKNNEAVQILLPLLHEMQSKKGIGIERYISKTVGMMGICYFNMKKHQRAIVSSERAFELCMRHNDIDGALIYASNLEAIYQQINDSEKITYWNQRRKQIQEQVQYLNKKENKPKQNQRMKSIQSSKNDDINYYKIDQLLKKIQTQLYKKDNIPEKAVDHYNKGRIHGEKGEYALALDWFKQTLKIAPNWSYPLYDMAYVLLFLGEWQKAYNLYKQVDKIYPRGFYATKTAIHTLSRETKNKLPGDTYKFFLTIKQEEDMDRKDELLDYLLDRCTEFAPAWLEKYKTVNSQNEQLFCLSKGLSYNSDPETKGLMLINQAVVFLNSNRKTEAYNILSELVFDENLTLQNEHLAKALLAREY